ncbi:MAG: Ig-like domain-containing protein, partial [Oscillospiraceae bacterium]
MSLSKKGILQRALGILLVFSIVFAYTSEMDLSFKVKATEIINADTSWYVGHETDSSFTIDTAEELAGLASIVNAGTDTFSGDTITLGADIVLNDISSFSSWGTTSPAWEFPVIGITISDPNGNFFEGTFDGDGHSITGLYVDDSTRTYAGLFDTLLTTSTVQDVVLNSCYINGVESIGGIAGYSSGTISGCTVSGVVKAAGNMVGGITGNNGGTVNGCANFANVSGVHKVGGIAGTSSAEASLIYNCYNTGTISGSVDSSSENYSDTGGILGDDATSTTANCYNLGNILGTNAVGGIGGFISGTVTNCYSAGTVTGNENYGGIVGSFIEDIDDPDDGVRYSYWDSVLFTGGGTGDGGAEFLTACASKTSTEMKAADFVTLLNTNKGTYSSWMAVADGYPTFGTAAPPAVAPTVTTQAVGDITQTTATGNGNITALGSSNVTAHGICWSTSENPTTSDNKTDEGAASATGAFTAEMTELTANATYYVRAYATNDTGTSYGEQVSFETLAAPVYPTVSSVSAPADSSYRAGQYLAFTVNFTESVNITGTPRLSLTVGTTTVYANYYSGSSTSALVFRYTIQSGDTDTDGITVGTLALNGGTIKNVAGTADATLTLNSVGSTTDVIVDTTAPTVSITSSASNLTNTSPIPVTITFSETVTDFTAEDITVTNGSKGTLSGSGSTYSINITPAG